VVGDEVVRERAVRHAAGLPQLLHDGGLDPTNALHALHHTIRELRDQLSGLGPGPL
jgi:hypothetical protein